MFERTSDAIARVLTCDATDRAGQGGLRQLVKTEHRAVPTGFIYPISNNPQLLHFVDFTYSDGTVETHGPAHGRGLTSSFSAS